MVLVVVMVFENNSRYIIWRDRDRRFGRVERTLAIRIASYERSRQMIVVRIHMCVLHTPSLGLSREATLDTTISIVVVVVLLYREIDRNASRSNSRHGHVSCQDNGRFDISVETCSWHNLPTANDPCTSGRIDIKAYLSLSSVVHRYIYIYCIIISTIYFFARYRK